MKKLIVGILVSAVFVYLSFRGIELQSVLDGLKGVRYVFVIPSLALLLSLALLRSLRWGIILSPIEEIDQKRLFPITCVGFMAIVLVPMRIGEFLRPYLVSTKSKVPLSSAMATIVVERVLDSFVLLVILLLVFLKVPLPVWLTRSGYGLLIAFGVFLLVMCLLHFKKGLALRLIHPVLERLPGNLETGIEGVVQRFAEGFKIIGRGRNFAWVVLLSMLIWGFSGMAIYALFLFYNFDLSMTSAFFVLLVTVIGISLPAAPAFLGNFQFACILALTLFDISKDNALAFSMVYYVLGIGVNVLLGLMFMPFLRISIEDMKNSFHYGRVVGEG